MATHHTFTTTYFDNMWDNMFVCGAEPGGRGWGVGAGGKGVVGFYEISSEINCRHIYLSDMLGGIHTYVMTSRTPVFIKN